MKEAIKIVFLGTPGFAVDSLDILIQAGYKLTAVVTSPDQPAGRGQLLRTSPVKDYALANGLKVLQPLRLKDPGFIDELHSLQADLFVVVAFRMLPEIVWQMPAMGTFNLHASLLPQYRGAAPINHAIINGEKETGLTTFFLKHEIDTGEILFQEKMQIFPEETAGELHDRMKTAGAKLVLKTVEAILEGSVKPIDQSKLAVAAGSLKPAPKITKEFCRINWADRSEAIFNKIRGLSPYPAAYTTLVSPAGDTVDIRIFKAGFRKTGRSETPGLIITDGKTGLSVTTTDGIIDVSSLQQSGKRRMKTADFLRGFRINSDWKMGI